ncbi:MAG: MinD/ParA family protein [Methanosarcinales archaeon]
MFIIPSSMEAEEIAKVLKEGYEISTLNQGFGELLEKLNLDFLIIDTHPGLEEETLLTTAISDILLVILRPDEQDYLGTAVTLEVAKKLEVPSIYLILNKVLEEYDFKEMKKEAEKAYGVKVAGILPFSEDLMKAGSKELFVLTLPEHKFSKEIAKIGEVLINNKYIEK